MGPSVDAQEQLRIFLKNLKQTNQGHQRPDADAFVAQVGGLSRQLDDLGHALRNPQVPPKPTVTGNVDKLCQDICNIFKELNSQLQCATHVTENACKGAGWLSLASHRNSPSALDYFFGSVIVGQSRARINYADDAARLMTNVARLAFHNRLAASTNVRRHLQISIDPDLCPESIKPQRHEEETIINDLYASKARLDEELGCEAGNALTYAWRRQGKKSGEGWQETQ